MSVQSMTGFARTEGLCGQNVWSWELKSVNAKGLDLRFRLPPGLELLENACRQAFSSRIARGTLSATLTVRRAETQPVVSINEKALTAVLDAAQIIAARVGGGMPSVDALLALRGIVEVIEPVETEDERKALQVAILGGLEEALVSLVAMREQEGAALATILLTRLEEIARLSEAAETHPARKPEAIRARLGESLAMLLDNNKSFDADRLHQEALLMAAKADIREELDRLKAHIDASRKLLAEGGAIGRKLDFLAQEFNRETNTLCSKSNDVSLTAIGLELKAVVEQFREQIQNLE